MSCSSCYSVPVFANSHPDFTNEASQNEAQWFTLLCSPEQVSFPCTSISNSITFIVYIFMKTYFSTLAVLAKNQKFPFCEFLFTYMIIILIKHISKTTFTKPFNDTKEKQCHPKISFKVNLHKSAHFCP